MDGDFDSVGSNEDNSPEDLDFVLEKSGKRALLFVNGCSWEEKVHLFLHC